MVRAIECTGARTLRLVDYPMPEMADDTILLRVRRAGVCGTDLEGIKGHRTLRFPVIPGHEVAAVVEHIGPNALRRSRVLGDSTLNVGDRVTINPRIVCGQCHYCRNMASHQEMCLKASTYGSSLGSAEKPHLLGCWAEHICLLPGSELIKLPDSLSDDLAVLTEPFGVAVGLVDRYQRRHEWIAGDGFGLHRTVVVFGAGTIGIFAAAAFHLAGAEQIVMVDIDEDRLALSRQFGVTHTFNAVKSPLTPEIIKTLTDGLGADIVVEACGVPRVIGQSLSLLRRGGTLFEIGHLANVGLAEIDPHTVCRNELEILGHYAYPTSQTLAYTTTLLAAHALPYETLMQCIALDDYSAVLDDNRRKGPVKMVFAI
jgi:threonine dehydrogenase-like Zn-dependent dehydrogenase